MCLADLNQATLSCRHRWYHLIRPCTQGATLTTCPTKLALEGWELKQDFCPFCSGWPVSNGEFLLFSGAPARSSSTTSRTTPAATDHHERSGSMSSSGSGSFAAGDRGSYGSSYGSLASSGHYQGSPGTPLAGVPVSARAGMVTSVSAARRHSRVYSDDGEEDEDEEEDTEGAAYSSPYPAGYGYDGPVRSAGERNRDLNARMHMYMSGLPEGWTALQQAGYGQASQQPQQQQQQQEYSGDRRGSLKWDGDVRGKQKSSSGKGKKRGSTFMGLLR